MSQINALARSFVDRSRYLETLGSLQKTITQLDLSIQILPVSDRPTQQTTQLPSESEGWSLVLELYFLQILTQNQAVLDFRPQSFRVSSSNSQRACALAWNPASVCMVWQDDFILALRDMYSGFYRNDGVLFKTALKKLGLSAAESVLRTHFGDNQSSHRFKLQNFLSTFNQVFLAAKKDKSRIHPQFLPFGLSLAGLYQSLELTNRSFDIRSCFLKIDDRIKSKCESL